MAIDSKHPEYVKAVGDWVLMRDAKAGERAVKEKGQVYLPATAGHKLDGMEKVDSDGYRAYQTYKDRAVFPDYVDDAVKTFLGLLHQKPAVFELPKPMEPLLTKATNKGESLLALLRRINEEQLTTGRIGLLLDMPINPDPSNPLPYIATYTPEAIINWHEVDSASPDRASTLDLVVLDETGEEMDAEFQWVSKERFRVLQLQDGTYRAGVYEKGQTPSEDTSRTPMFRGTPLTEMPFVIINSQDVLPTPDKPPLIGLGRLCLTIYRGEADYRYTLYMQSQETLVVVGGAQGEDDQIRVGAGARIDVDLQGDAKYIGVSGGGLTEQRTALENDRKLGERLAGQLVQAGKSSQESGEALKTRMAGQVATLFQMALAAALGLENILKTAARWMGCNPDEVKVAPNLEFVTQQLTGQDILQLMTARQLGAPLSFKSMHNTFIDRGLTSLTYEEELEQIAEEDAERATRQSELPLPGSNAPGANNEPPANE